MSPSLRLSARSNVALPSIRSSLGNALPAMPSAPGAADWDALLRRLDAVEAKLSAVDRLAVQMAQLTQTVERMAQSASVGEANRRDLGEIKRSLEAIRRRFEC